MGRPCRSHHLHRVQHCRGVMEVPQLSQQVNLLYHVFLCMASLPSISQGGALDRIIFQSGLVMSDRP